MSDDALATIRCSVCGGEMLTVPERVAKAFSSGRWVCARAECHDKLEAARAAAEGRML